MLIYWFLPMILFLGIVTSYEDLKFGKIRNKWIVLAVTYGIIANLLLFSFGYNNLDYLIKFSINSLMSLAIGFIIWYANLWTAGDAKLFFAFAALLPVYGLQGYFFSINFLLNAFIPILTIFLFYLLFKSTNKEKLFHFKKIFNARAIFNLIIFIFGFSWVISLILNFLGLKSNIFLFLFIVLLFYYFIERILKLEIFYISLLLSFGRLVFDSSIYSFQFIYQFILLVVLFLIIRFFMLSISFRHFSRELKFSQLKEGMVPAEIIYTFKGKYYKKPRRFSIIGFKKKKVGKLLFRNYNGLAKEDINRLKSLQKGLPFKTLRIQSTMAFAPFLFLGALLTIIFNGGTFLSLVKFINF